MAGSVIECVPNFSEGRDPERIGQIVEAVASTAGAQVLGWTSDPDHNRSVITFAGGPEAVAQAAFAAIERAVHLIDLNHHRGVHPRIGAADVVPFIPLRNSTIEGCAALAQRLAERIWNNLRVPVYLYEAAARDPGRADLADIRRGGFEQLREQAPVNPARRPDYGGPGLHPTAGACVIGARRLLIAFNINLDTTDVTIARRIARKIRYSSGGLPFVKAIGLFLESRNCAQVSINLTNFEKTPLADVFHAVQAETGHSGVRIAGSEIVGLIPRAALQDHSPADLLLRNFHPGLILENRLEETGLGEMA